MDKQDQLSVPMPHELRAAARCHDWRAWMWSGWSRMNARASASFSSLGPPFTPIGRASFADHPSRAFAATG